jgi:hypothetical protein
VSRSYCRCTATISAGGGGMAATMPLAAVSACVVSSATSKAGRQSIQPSRHTGAFGGMAPAASPASSSSVRTRRC